MTHNSEENVFCNVIFNDQKVVCAGLGEHRPPLRARHRAEGGQENQGNQAQDGPGREQKWIRQVFQVGRYCKFLKSKTCGQHFIFTDCPKLTLTMLVAGRAATPRCPCPASARSSPSTTPRWPTWQTCKQWTSNHVSSITVHSYFLKDDYWYGYSNQKLDGRSYST